MDRVGNFCFHYGPWRIVSILAQAVRRKPLYFAQIVESHQRASWSLELEHFKGFYLFRAFEIDPKVLINVARTFLLWILWIFYKWVEFGHPPILRQCEKQTRQNIEIIQQRVKMWKLLSFSFHHSKTTSVLFVSRLNYSNLVALLIC